MAGTAAATELLTQDQIQLGAAQDAMNGLRIGGDGGDVLPAHAAAIAPAAGGENPAARILRLTSRGKGGEEPEWPSQWF